MIYPSKPIGDLVEKVSTWNPRNETGAESFKYIDLSSVDKKKKIIDSELVPIVEPQEAPSRARQLVECNDVLVATVRPNLNGVALVESHEYSGATASTGYCVLRPNTKKLDSKYLYYWVTTENFVNEMIRLSTGANYPAVSDKIIKNSKIPLPSLKEQKRIAAILDKADAIRRKRQQAIDLTDQLLRSVFLDMFGDPVTNPKGWDVKSFSSLGTWSSGGTPSRKNKEYFTGDIDWYSAGELNTRYVNTSIEKITKTAIKESAAKLFKSGSILLGMYDTAAFKSSILKTDSASNQACTNLDPNDSISVEWFYTYIQIAKEHYLRLRRGVRQKNLNLGMIKEFELPLPPIGRQKKFEKICGSILKLGVTDHDSYELIESLFNSLTQQTFNGELSKQSKAA